MAAISLIAIARAGRENTWNAAVLADYTREGRGVCRSKKMRTEVCSCLIVSDILDVPGFGCAINQRKAGEGCCEGKQQGHPQGLTRRARNLSEGEQGNSAPASLGETTRPH